MSEKFKGDDDASPSLEEPNVRYTEKLLLSYQYELKRDLCWAIDVGDIKLLESSYRTARKVLGGRKGRPRAVTEGLKKIREEVKANFCLYLSERLGYSYSNVWASYFLNKSQPKKPASSLLSAVKVRYWCDKYPDTVKSHLYNVLDSDADGRELLRELLDSKT